MKKDIRAFFRVLRDQGWIVEPTSGGHYKLIPPDGPFIICSSTPSDWRAIRKIRAACRKRGADFPRKGGGK